MECPVESTADRKARLVSRADNNGLIITTKIEKYLLRQDQQVFMKGSDCALVSVLIQLFYEHLKTGDVFRPPPSPPPSPAWQQENLNLILTREESNNILTILRVFHLTNSHKNYYQLVSWYLMTQYGFFYQRILVKYPVSGGINVKSLEVCWEVWECCLHLHGLESDKTLYQTFYSTQ